jgi:transposase InsO family protein
LHSNAKLTPAGRRILVARIAAGRPAAHVAAEMGVARQTAYKWWRRWLAEGDAGLRDRTSRPLRSPRRLTDALERRVELLRRQLKLGPARIGWQLGLARSTVYRALCRLGLNRLAWLDRPSGRTIRRYEHASPGDLVHMDIKKLGRIPDGGGWRVLGRDRAGQQGHSRVGYAFVHSAVDDHTRLAYTEVMADERGATAAAFWSRARDWFAAHGVTISAVLTDNGSAYRSADFARSLGSVRHRFTRPYRPQTNGKVERFNRTLLEEWAYVRPYRSERARTTALARWLHVYNHHRQHTALGGLPPISRVTNVHGRHS